jgi:hypothetical protein
MTDESWISRISTTYGRLLTETMIKSSANTPYTTKASTPLAPSGLYPRSGYGACGVSQIREGVAVGELHVCREHAGQQGCVEGEKGV